MKIGRLEFGKAYGASMWGPSTGACGCKFLDLGSFYITWISNDCKCTGCKKHKCECDKDKE